MKIAIIASSSWPVCYPIPHKSRSGDSFYACLAATLDEMGHEVSFVAPAGSYVPPHGQLLEMTCNWGLGSPPLEYCEREAFQKYKHILIQQDIVHDFSNFKYVVDSLYASGYTNVLSTILGGAWVKSTSPHNLTALSNSHCDRVMRGKTDYENTPTPNMDTSITYPVKNVHRVYLGIDTDQYTPVYEKKNFFLWLSRWHTVRGYKLAIQLAKETGIELIIAGNSPNAELQKTYQAPVYEAMELAKDISNIHFEWLPDDPIEHQKHKITLLQNAKAFIYSVQFNEPFGLMQPEALACGTPIIGTNYGSVPEIIEDGITGYVVNNNLKDFANAITKIDNINLHTCRNNAVNRFSRYTMAMNYIQEYQKVINGERW